MNEDQKTEGGGGAGGPWGTLEELLLACAVKRHGAKRWDSVSMELQSRTPDHHLRAFYTPPDCRRKYVDLRRRFSGGDDDDDEETSKTMVDELKKLRVAELRREVERHDVSIEFLQLKVKSLEEGRGQSFKVKEEAEREETDLSTDPENQNAGKIAARQSISGDSSGGRANRSLNESNSATNQKVEPESDLEPEIKDVKPDEYGSGTVQTGSKPDSSCSLALKLTEVVEGIEGMEDVAESKREGTEEETKQSGGGEQSSGKKKRRRRRRFSMASSSGEDEPDGDEVPLAAKQIAIKCQPLIKILAVIRLHNGSAFERRRRSQETEKYKKMIRRHMDLQMVQRRLEQGLYLHSRRKFFRDILLIFVNALTFFPSNSNEFSAASDLLKLVAARMAAKSPKPNLNTKKPAPDRPRPERAPSPPIVLCQRRSSTSSKRAPNPVVVDAKIRGKVLNSNLKAKEKITVKKQGVKESKSKINRKKDPVKEESGSDDEEEEEEEEMGRGRKGKDVRRGKELCGRKEREREESSIKLGKRGRPGNGSPLVAAAGRGGKRGKEGGGGGGGAAAAAAAAGNTGRTRKRPKR